MAYIGIVAEKYEKDNGEKGYQTAEHVGFWKNGRRQTYLVKMDYNGKVIRADPISIFSILPGYKVTKVAKNDENMDILVTPRELKAEKELNSGKIVPLGPRIEISDVIKKLGSYKSKAPIDTGEFAYNPI